MSRPAPPKVHGRIRLRRNRPVNLSVGRIILTGLLYPSLDHLYQGAQLITADPATDLGTVHNLRIGATFELEGTWILHTVLDLDHGDIAADIFRRTRRTFTSPSGTG